MAAAAGAVAAMIAQAIKASGVLIRVEPKDFQSILARVPEPLVIQAEGGIFSTKYQYLVSYKGFAFFTKSSTPLPFPNGVETVRANKIWIPG